MGVVILSFHRKSSPPDTTTSSSSCNSLNDVGSARDLCLSRGVPVAIDLGCHMNDHMVSFYMGNPSNFALEYGWSGRTIDPASWQAEHYTAFDSIWGHAQLRDMVAGLAPGKK